MNLAEQLRILQAADGDPAKLVLATVDLKYPELPEADRAWIKDALEAAAIPHWCDEPILAVLLEISLKDSARRLTQLRGLTVVEPFPARGETAVNVHEAARLELRKQMAQQDKPRFRRLSSRAAESFRQDQAPARQIEWIYHRLVEDPNAAADELENLDRQWTGSARPEDRQALAAALRDLEVTKLVDGAARAEVLLCIAEARNSRAETTRLEQPAREVLALARSVHRSSCEGRANCLLGDVLQAQGKGCGPGILGVCIGGDRATGYEHSKLQFLRRLEDRNPNADLDALEQDILKTANELGIGPMGFGGKTTLLGVKICAINRLPASYFVSVSYMCWAYRRQGISLNAEGGIRDWLY
jgi:hypothetical protein